MSGRRAGVLTLLLHEFLQVGLVDIDVAAVLCSAIRDCLVLFFQGTLYWSLSDSESYDRAEPVFEYFTDEVRSHGNCLPTIQCALQGLQYFYVGELILGVSPLSFEWLYAQVHCLCKDLH